jgi:short subunit fatty acids transporter
MPRHTIDWTNIAPIVIVTGAASANAQLKAIPAAGDITRDPAYRGFCWYMVVSGTPCYINWGTSNAVTASSANVLHPVGRDDAPKLYPLLPAANGGGPGLGYWVAALALSGGAGQLCFVFGSEVGV